MSEQVQAAICYGPQQPFSISELTLDNLRADEIRVRVVACGICHTDLAVRDKQLPVPLPVVLGHEGAGIVEEVGSAVTKVHPGDRVIMSFNSCGQCPNCHDNSPTYCYDFFAQNWNGTRTDGSSTLFQNNEPVAGNFFGQSAFATQAIAHERNVIVVPEGASHIPLEQLAPLGCGLMTGAGGVLRSLKVRKGLPIAVFGTGTVGMAAIMAAKIAGANPIIAVDVNDARLQLAKQLGATHVFNGKDNAPEQIRASCPAGIGYAFDTTGINKVIQDAWSLLAPKGVVGIVGASDPSAMLEFNEAEFMGGGRTVKGVLGGDSDLGPFMSELIEHHLQGRFPFERLIQYFDFADINEAIASSENGSVIKPVLRIGREA